MTDQTDHYAEAERILTDGNRGYDTPALTVLTVVAQAHATLAVVDAVRALASKGDTGVNMEAPETQQDDITEEPPIGTHVTDEGGDVWERRDEGWHLWVGREWDSGADWWSRVRDHYAPLRLTTDADRERVGLPVSEPETPEADDPDEALARVLADVDPHSAHGWDALNDRGRSMYLILARAAREHIEAQGTDDPTYRAAFEGGKEVAASSPTGTRVAVDGARRNYEAFQRANARAEKAEAEVEQVTRERDNWQALAKDLNRAIDQRGEQIVSLAEQVAATRFDSDGNALVTVRAEDVTHLLKVVDEDADEFDPFAADRLRRALDERGES